jgi:hypothetical protein
MSNDRMHVVNLQAMTQQLNSASPLYNRQTELDTLPYYRRLPGHMNNNETMRFDKCRILLTFIESNLFAACTL